MPFLLNLVVARSRMGGSASPSRDSHVNMVFTNLLVICFTRIRHDREWARSSQKGFGVKTQPAFWSADHEFGVFGAHFNLPFRFFQQLNSSTFCRPLLRFSQSFTWRSRHCLEWPRGSLGNRQSKMFAAVPCFLGEGNTTS